MEKINTPAKTLAKIRADVYRVIADHDHGCLSHTDVDVIVTRSTVCVVIHWQHPRLSDLAWEVYDVLDVSDRVLVTDGRTVVTMGLEMIEVQHNEI